MGFIWHADIQKILLSTQATFKGWMDIMYAAVDSREVREWQSFHLYKLL